MIAYPDNWQEIGIPIQIKQIEDIILQILSDINCISLSFSGGIDSSLMLHYMAGLYGHVEVYTMGVSEEHPDVVFSKMMARRFRNAVHRIYIPTIAEIEAEEQTETDFAGDYIVRMFYKFVANYTAEIIACDTIDEFMCGYYAHQEDPSEATYYKYIRELQELHLMPLNKNSGNVKVYLPYADPRLIYLLSQIPLFDKVDQTNRKKVMQALAGNKVPQEIIMRHKYGFCDAFTIKN